MSNPERSKQVIIQLTSPCSSIDMKGARRLLRGFGVRLDSKYGPYLVNPILGNYVVRGKVSSENLKKAIEIEQQKKGQRRRV